jgi:hypothetical protein
LLGRFVLPAEKIEDGDLNDNGVENINEGKIVHKGKIITSRYLTPLPEAVVKLDYDVSLVHFFGLFRVSCDYAVSPAVMILSLTAPAHGDTDVQLSLSLSGEWHRVLYETPGRWLFSPGEHCYLCLVFPDIGFLDRSKVGVIFLIEVDFYFGFRFDITAVVLRLRLTLNLEIGVFDWNLVLV